MMNPSTLYKTPDGEQVVMAIYDSILKQWPVRYETLMIPTRYGDTFVIACGDPHWPALILLHGAGSSSTIWARDVIDYSARFRVYAVDLPGEAGKSSTNRPAWDTPAFAEWLEDVLDELHIQQATLLGLSQGAFTALKFAVSKPERVDKLVLISPGGIVPDRGLFLLRAVILSLLGKWGIRRLVQALFGDQQVPESVIDIVAQITRHFRPRIGKLPIFSDDELRRLTIPVLLLGGTKDIIRDLNKIAARLRDLLPDLTVTIIQGGGHALVNTSPRVMEFLNTSAI